MSFLPVSLLRRRQPDYLAQPSERWIQNGMVALFDVQRGIEVIAQNRCTVSTAMPSPGRQGVGADFSGTANQQYPHRAAYAITGPLTIVAFLDVRALSNYSAVIIKNHPPIGNLVQSPFGFSLGATTTGSELNLYRAGANYGQVNSGASRITAPFSGVVILTTTYSDVQSPIVAWVNNQKFSAGAAGGNFAPTDDGSSPVWIGRRDDGATQLDGRIYYVALFNTVPQDGFLQGVVDAPWSAYRPDPNDVVYFLPAAAGSVGASDGTSTALAIAGFIGASAGTSTVAAVGAALDAAVGASAGTSTALATAGFIGASSGTSTATAIGAALDAAVGASAGVGAAAATSAASAAAAGASAGVGAASGVGAAAAPAVGAASGVGAATAAGQSTANAVGASAGVASVSGTSSGASSSVGDAAGTSTVAAVGTGAFQAPGASAGTSTCTGAGAALYSSVGAAAGIGSAAAIGAALAATLGQSSGIAVATAGGAQLYGAVGTAAGTSTATGVGSLLGYSNGAGSAAGTCSVLGVGNGISYGLIPGSSRVYARKTRQLAWAREDTKSISALVRDSAATSRP